MKFPYVDRGGGLMPIIPVTLNYDDDLDCIPTEALVDSGAGLSIFDAELAEELGIPDIESGDEASFEGVTGHRFIGYSHGVTLIIGGVHFQNVSVAFSRSMPDNATNILGQQGFFSLFPVKLTYSKNEVELMCGSNRFR